MTAELRQTLNRILSDETIDYFCYDHFREVYDNFSSGMTRTEKIHRLIEYTERTGQGDRLLTILKIAPEPEPQPEPRATRSDNLCLQMIESRIRLNALIDVAEHLGDMPRWLHDWIQAEHDRLHDLKLRIFRG